MTPETTLVDLALAVSWEYDEPFVELIERAIQEAGISAGLRAGRHARDA
jgi:hypothetical protein